MDDRGKSFGFDVCTEKSFGFLGNYLCEKCKVIAQSIALFLKNYFSDVRIFFIISMTASSDVSPEVSASPVICVWSVCIA